MIVDYTLSDYVNLIIKRRRYFLTVLMTSFAAATIFSLSVPKIYQAKLKMYAPTTMDVMSFSGRGQGTQLRPLIPNLNELYSGAMLGLLKSERMKEMLIEKLAEEKKRKVSFIIDFSPDYGHFMVKVNDRDNKRAARIANIIPEVANELIVEVSESSLRNNIRYMRAQRDTAEKNLEEARKKLRDFQEKHIHVVLGQQSSMIISKNAEFQVEYDRLGLDLERIRATIDELTKQMRLEAELFVEEEAVTQDLIIQQLRNALTEKEMRMASMTAQLTEIHPSVIALQKEIDETKELIRREVERLFASKTKPSNSFYEILRQSVVQNYVSLTSTRARQEALSRLIKKSNELLISLPTVQNELANLAFDEKIREKTVESLVSRLTELELQIGRQFQTFVVLERAKTPKSARFPILWLNLLIALVFGAGGGVFYCTLLEYFERAKIVRFANEGQM